MPIPTFAELLTKIRYKDKGAMATLTNLDDGRIKAHFAHSVSAIAPGQSAVFYEGDDVVGGGFIAREKEVPLSHAHKLINKE